MAEADDAIEQLHTVGDWLRYAISRFTRANLAYGHGTTNPIDEAAFLVLEALRLPIEDVNPWVATRLLMAERRRLHHLISARIETRKPAPYLLGAAYIQDRRFIIDERAIVPRSYLGELLLEGEIENVLADFVPTRILELCTGSGALAILAAETFPDAHVDAVELSADALALAAINVAAYGLTDQVMLHEGDLFAPIGGRTYDLILANPPYVTTHALRAFPPEYRAEPLLAHHGGEDGLDLVQRILDGAAAHLTEHGMLVMEIGRGREALHARRPDLDPLWLDTARSSAEVLVLHREDLLPEGETRAPANAGRAKKRTPRRSA